MPTACETYAALYFSSVGPTATAVKSKAAQQRTLFDPTARLVKSAASSILRPILSAELDSISDQSASGFSQDVEAAISTTALTSADVLVGRLLSLGELEEDWDGNGASKPAAASIKAAKSFARSLSPESIIPKATLLADGNAVLYVSNHGLYAELEFPGDETYSYYIRRGTEECFDEAKLDAQGLPKSLTEIGLAKESWQDNAAA